MAETSQHKYTIGQQFWLSSIQDLRYSRDGYEFVYWKDVENNVYNDSQAVTFLKVSTDISAVWIDKNQKSIVVIAEKDGVRTKYYINPSDRNGTESHIYSFDGIAIDKASIVYISSDYDIDFVNSQVYSYVNTYTYTSNGKTYTTTHTHYNYPAESFPNLEDIEVYSQQDVDYLLSFDHMEHLRSVKLLLNAKHADLGTFVECPNLSSVSIPNVEIINYDTVFAYCNNLVQVNISGCQQIGEDTFRGSYKLSSIYLPSMKRICINAFRACNINTIDFGTNMLSVPYFGDEPENPGEFIKFNSLDDFINAGGYIGGDSFTKLSCYVPYRLYDEWTADPFWKYLVDRGHVVILRNQQTYVQVTFKFMNGMPDEVMTVDYNCDVEPPENPSKTGYTFIEWDVQDNFTNITCDLTATAQYQINTYTAKFVNYDGSVIEEKQLNYDSQLEYPVHPDNKIDYDPAGWSSVILKMPDHDVQISALYTIKRYSVTFIDSAAKADFVNAQNYSKQYDIHTNVVYPEVSCMLGYAYNCDPDEISDLTSDVSVNLYTVGKGYKMLEIAVSGDTSDKTMCINGIDQPVMGSSYSITDNGDSVSSIILFADDLQSDDHIVIDMTSAFVDLGSQLKSIDYVNPTYLSTIDDMANGCTNITHMSLTELTAVKSAVRMFNGCTNLTHLSICNNSFIDRIGDNDAFVDCNSLSCIRYIGKLSSYQDNQILSACFGEAEVVSVDFETSSTYSKLTGGIYGQQTKQLITDSDNIVIISFNTERYPGAQSGIKDNIKYSEKGQKFGYVPRPALDGYVVKDSTRGWLYENGDVVTNIDRLEDDTTVFLALQTITYNITYVENGGELPANRRTQYNVEMSVELPAEVTRANYHFAGWFDNAELTGNAITEIPVGSTGDMTLYAKWTEIKYKVLVNIDTERFTANGISTSHNVDNGGVVDGGGEYTYNTDVTLKAIPYDGFEFKQWNDGSTDAVRQLKIETDVSYTATFTSLDQTRAEYFVTESDTPNEGEVTIIGINDTAKPIVRYLNIPEQIEL